METKLKADGMIEAIELFHQDGQPAGIWYCSQCRAVFPEKGQAEACHGTRLCACGKLAANRYSESCQECESKAWRERMVREEMERYEKATKVPAAKWNGDQVFWDGCYFETVDEAIEHAESGGMPTPKYIWAARNQGVPRADIEDLLTNVLDSMWEDADMDDLNGVQELEAAIAVFNEANKGVVVWMVDHSTAIVLSAQQGGEI